MVGPGNNNGEGSSGNSNGGNGLNPAVAAAIAAAVNAAVNAAMQNLPVGPQGPEGPPGPPGEGGNQGPRWNASDVGFFDPFYEGKSAASGEPIVHSGKDTYFRDVHIFIDRIKDMALIKGSDVIRNNLSTCLRGTALNWYHAELSDEGKRILKYGNDVEEWSAALLKRFKENPSTAMAVITKERYSLDDARRHREPREYAQVILRAAKSAMMTSVYNQLFLIYNGLDVEFQQHLTPPTPETTIDSFLGQLDMKREIWWALANRHRIGGSSGVGSSQKEKPSYRYEGNRNSRPNNGQGQSQYFNRQDYFKPGFTPVFPSFSNYGGGNFNNQYQNRTYPQNPQYQTSPSYGNQPSNAKAIMPPPTNQKQITGGTESASGSQPSKYQNQPQNQYQNQYRNQYRNQRQPFRSFNAGGRPQRAYHGDGSEEGFTIEGDNEYYDENESQDTEANFIADGTAQKAFYEEADDQADVNFVTPPVIAFTCRRCHSEFPSNNKLHSHVRSCWKPKATSEALTNHVDAARPIDTQVIESTAPASNGTGYGFRSWHYALLEASLDTIDGPRDQFCIDTGCTMSLVDQDYLMQAAPNTKIQISKTSVKVRGIGASVYDSSKYVVMDFFVPGLTKSGEQAIAHFTRELHLVKELKAKVLIGMDILGPEGIDVSHSKRKIVISSCDDFTANLIITPKGQRTERTVRALKRVQVPAHSIMTIPVRIRGKSLPEDRDYLFEPKAFTELGSEGGFLAHVINANIVGVQMRNCSDEAFVVPKNFGVGTITDYAEEGCYLASDDDAHLAIKSSTKIGWWSKAKDALFLGCAFTAAASSLITDPESTPSIATDLRTNMETVMPNGITVYGDPSAYTRLSTVAETYPNIWNDIGGVIDVPESDWMPINTLAEAKPEPAKVYPLGPADRQVVDNEFDQLHAQGKMEWTKEATPYAYPVFVVWRTLPDGTRKGRVVVDIRGLNKISEFDAYPMPLQADILSSVSGCMFISVMDCTGFFHQWRVSPDHRHKLTVVSHRGSERWNVAVMGYKNSPAYVQRQIDTILRPYRTFARAYVDDVVIFSRSLEEHLRHLNQVFKLFQDRNIVLKPSKTYLGYPTIALLGQKVSSLGMTAPTDKLKAISEIEFPRTLKQLETYLGKTGWLRHYVPYYAQKAAPLQRRKTRLLKPSPTKGSARKSYSNRTILDDPTAAEIDAFEQLQEAFSRTTYLVHFDRQRRLFIDVDASKERGFGVMIYHVKNDDALAKPKSPPPKNKEVEPIMFLSKILSQAEQRYWPTELEMAGLVWVITKTHSMIRSSDHPTIVYTDHGATPSIASQTKLTTSSTDKANLRLVRASTYLSQFRLDIRHKPGKAHIVPDALSRLPSRNTGDENIDSLDIFHTSTEDGEAFAFNGSLIEVSEVFRKRLIQGYENDPAWSKIRKMLLELQERAGIEDLDAKATSQAMILYDPAKTTNNLKVPSDQTEEGASTGIDFELLNGLIFHIKDKPRLCIPATMEKEVFAIAHDANAHAGQHRAYQRLLNAVYIPRMSRKLHLYLKHCPSCQLNQTKRHRPYGELRPLSTPDLPFHTLAMDFVVALPGTFDSLLTVTCKFSRKLMLIPGKTTYTAVQWSDQLLDRLLLADWGIPRAIISDRDPKFLSEFWRAMFQKLNVSLLFSSAYHPQTDGLSERSNQTVEIALRYLTTEYPNQEWTTMLPALQASLNNTPNSSTHRSPNEVVYGFKVREAMDVLGQEANAHINIDEERFRHRAEAADATSYASAKAKIYYDSRHQPLLFKPGDQAFLRLHHGYSLPGKPNPKLSNQRTGPFLVKRRVGRLAYELELPPQWRVHPVISVTQLEPMPGRDPYDRYRPHHPASVHMEGDTETEKSYEVEKLVSRRIRRYGKKDVTQYLIRWSGYGPEYDEWKSLSALGNSMDLVEEYEKANPPESKTSMASKRGRGRPKKVLKKPSEEELD